MGHEHRVAPARRESSVGLVGELEFGQDFAAFKAEIPGRESFYFDHAEAAFICHRIAPFDLSSACSPLTKAFDWVAGNSLQNCK